MIFINNFDVTIVSKVGMFLEKFLLISTQANQLIKFISYTRFKMEHQKSAELSTQQAANTLKHPFFTQLLEKYEFPHRKFGTHKHVYLNEEINLFELGQSYPAWTPHNAFSAADTLLNALQEDKTIN